jgi:ligand-binding SRPBCC domain-containing protein
MKIYTILRKQFLPALLDEAWEFFLSPENLSSITPPHMGFEIRYFSGSRKTYSGQIIKYKVGIFPGIKVNWVTEITHVKDKEYFIDEQRFGPYKLWQHQHHFREVSGGIEMTDEVNYAIPFGLFGRLVHFLFVGKEVNKIFDYREKVLKNIFREK